MKTRIRVKAFDAHHKAVIDFTMEVGSGQLTRDEVANMRAMVADRLMVFMKEQVPHFYPDLAKIKVD